MKIVGLNIVNRPIRRWRHDCLYQNYYGQSGGAVGWSEWRYLARSGFKDSFVQWLYEEVYCQRGDIENHIKELHYGMEIGRTSCTSFWANQLRVSMTAAAYVLMQELRLGLAGTTSARALVSILRERLLKIGVQVVASVRRIVLHLPQSFPYLRNFHRLALNLSS